jgi:succinoglycan biosynthesis transport protein ExoP
MNDMNFRRGGAIATDMNADVGGPLTRGPSRAMPLLTQYLAIARRRKWVILGAVVAALVAGLLLTLLMTSQYTATSTIEIQRESFNIVQVDGVEPESNTVDMEFYQTQYGLLRAQSLAERIATELRLTESEEFFRLMGSNEVDGLFENGRPKIDAASRQARLKEAAELLLDNVTIAPVRMSRLVDISFTSPDPGLSQRVADAWASNFIESNLERRFEATSYARNFLQQRLEQLRGRLDESERLLVAYATRQSIINLPSGSPAGENGVTSERPLLADDLTALNQSLAEATSDRVRAESRLRAAGGSVSEALENNAISGLRQRRAELASEYSKMLVQFEPQYPPARALASQIAQLDQSLAREESRVKNSLQEAFRSSVERERNLAQRVNGLKGDLLDLRRRSIQYNIYQRDVDTNRQLYDGLLQRYKEIGVAGGVGVNNIAVVDKAQIPSKPSSPNLPLNLLLALLAGTIIGAGLAFALEQIDEAITDPTSVEHSLGLPLLGTIPKVSDADPVESLQDRKSPVSEAYLSVQTNLAFSTDHGVPRSIAITSTRPSEGKTTTSYAIASSLARTGRRVILIDGDMRSPSIHHVLGIGNDRGFSNYLTGEDDLASLVSPGPNGLSIMAAGPQPPNAAELLTSERLQKIIKDLQASFDHVVFDAPPVMGLADAPLLGSQVEGVVFVIESHGTKESMARVAIGRLQSAQVHLIGTVLTKFEAKRAHYGYGYDYGYSYGEPPKARA